MGTPINNLSKGFKILIWALIFLFCVLFFMLISSSVKAQDLKIDTIIKLSKGVFCPDNMLYDIKKDTGIISATSLSGIITPDSTIELNQIHFWRTYPRTITMDDFNVSVRETSEKDDILILTLNLLLEYEKHCYNDSTLVDVYIDPNIYTEISPGIYSGTSMHGYYKKEWVHKKSPFTDIIKWIKNKNN